MNNPNIFMHIGIAVSIAFSVGCGPSIVNQKKVEKSSPPPVETEDEAEKQEKEDDRNVDEPKVVPVKEIEEPEITRDEKIAIIDALSGAYNETYVFPDVAKKMVQKLRKSFKSGKYNDVTKLSEFAEILTRDLQEVSNDKHVSIQYLPPAARKKITEEPDPEAVAFREKQMKRENYHFKQVDILPGNVGYLRFDAFAVTSLAGPTAVAAMRFLANCDAIIFDLRYNGGGSPSMDQLLTSFLVKESTHINSIYSRKTDETKQFWTQPYVPGPTLVDADVYVLTSTRTFSAAEAFTYSLKNLKRATIIGETTGGAAHFVGRKRFPELGIVARVPFGRAINPISGTNWEGTGVTPHIEAAPKKAVAVAHLEALKKLKEKTSDETEKAGIEWAITGLGASLNPVVIKPEVLEKYTGKYDGSREIKTEDGELFYRRGESPWMRLIPITETLFEFELFDDFRLEVVSDSDENPIKLVWHYTDGSTDETLREY